MSPMSEVETPASAMTEEAGGHQSSRRHADTPAGAARPIRLTPPLRPQSGASGGRTTSRRPRLGTLVLFALLAAAAVIVFGILPRWIRAPATLGPSQNAQDTSDDPAVPPRTRLAPPEPRSASSTGTAPGPGALEDPQPERDRAAAERALARLLSVRETVEGLSAELWGGALLARARAAADEGDEQLGRGRFDRATEAYSTASRAFEELLGRADETLQQSLDRGAAALAAGDGDAAATAFGLALAIDADNPVALAGVKRAGVAGQVSGLLSQAASRERSGDLTGAAESYRRALALDAASGPARDGLARTRRRLGEEAFAAVMAEGLEALDRGELGAARAAFERARGLQPNAPQIAEALARVEERARLDSIDEHLRAARSYETGEEWRSAAGEYSAVLDIDGRIKSAREGRERATARADLSDALDAHLARPERLSEETVLTAARRVLTEATDLAADDDVGKSSPRLQQQIDELGSLIEAWATPVVVVLQSDALTEVTIYRIGRLGTFRRRELSLRPGTYTVVGSRLGYRDERLTLVVPPGSSLQPLSIQCREEI